MSAGVTFATLDNVGLREAWAHEAHGFTPWLAENLGRISDAIGIPLELERTEAPVGRYAADILARNPIDDSLVLIENQLEHGDHTHLGQILTYLTGLRASTVVWVAADFRDEHLSAIQWLNNNTVDPFAFFAVKLRVVRIADSPFAPLFEVIERPNQWDRQIQEGVRASADVSPRTASLRAFWTHYGARHPQVQGDIGAGGGVARWRQVPGTDLVVSQWVSKTRAGVFVRGGRGRDGAAVFDRLEAHRAALEARLGCEIGNRAYPLEKYFEVDTLDAAQWDRISDWLNATVDTYVAGLSEVMGHPDQ